MIYEEFYDCLRNATIEKMNREFYEMMGIKFTDPWLQPSELFGAIKPYVVWEHNEKIRTEKRMNQLKNRVGETC